MITEEYKFLINIDADLINEELVDKFHRGGYGIICVDNATDTTIDQIGELLDQDMYGR